jgi:hypothetical protein
VKRVVICRGVEFDVTRIDNSLRGQHEHRADDEKDDERVMCRANQTVSGHVR